MPNLIPVTPKKPKWFKPALSKVEGVSCACCGNTTLILPVETKMYHGMGGMWTITKNGQHFFSDDRDVEFDQYHDLKHVEDLIGENTEDEFIADFTSPLRGSVYQRHAKNNWVLIETNEGYA